jgi:hypothetical protein
MACFGGESVVGPLELVGRFLVCNGKRIPGRFALQFYNPKEKDSKHGVRVRLLRVRRGVDGVMRLQRLDFGNPKI